MQPRLVYGKAARAQFSAEELVKQTVVVIAIDGWNRLATA
jgi:alkylhydroperoxidase family enzyme